MPRQARDKQTQEEKLRKKWTDVSSQDAAACAAGMNMLGSYTQYGKKKRSKFFSPFYFSSAMIILPRQARDKRRESTQNEVPFSYRLQSDRCVRERKTAAAVF